jgi:phenylpropionate dioxygenase-like ring-hydroxylating dioxygenase large terminal subunit
MPAASAQAFVRICAGAAAGWGRSALRGGGDRRAVRPCLPLRRRRRVQPPVTAVVSASQPSPRPSALPDAQLPFDWPSQWYPVALEADLSTSDPTPVQVLARRLVVWKTDTAARTPPRAARAPPHRWAVFHDVCPHRGAALSEGRIDRTTGNLQCGYHGWQFDARAACTAVPQAPDASAAASPLACARAVPARVDAGVLFAWLGAGPPPEGAPPPAVAAGARARYVVSAYARELPFAARLLLENVLDPAHIHFAHHGQLGRRADAAPIDVRVLPPAGAAGPGAPAFAADYYEGRVLCRWRPPCLVEIVNAAGMSFAYYAVPIDAHRCRTIGITSQAHKPTLRQRWTPRWVDHLRRHSLVDGDLTLIYSQGREAAAAARASATPAQDFLPTSSDRLIVLLRRWLRRNPAPELPGAGDHAASLPGIRRELLDRQRSHTDLCAGACAGALRSTRRLKRAAAIAGCLFAALSVSASVAGRAAAARGTGLPARTPARWALAASAAVSPQAFVVAVGGALGALAAYRALHALEQRFIYVEGARKRTHGP